MPLLPAHPGIRVGRVLAPERAVVLAGYALGSSTVTCELSKLDGLDREIEALLALDLLIPA